MATQQPRAGSRSSSPMISNNYIPERGLCKILHSWWDINQLLAVLVRA